MSPEHRQGRRGSERTRRVLRELHNQTWELELLISGTVAIVLAFLPSRVDEFYFAASAQTTGAVDQIAFLVFYVAKLTLYTLILAFGFHIAIRAFWVAMVGLDSVFPRGPKWGELRVGPVARGVYRRELPSVRELIVWSDAVASVTFAAAFSLVAIFAVSIPWAVAFGIATAVVVKVLGLGVSTGAALGLGVIVGGLLVSAPVLIDRWFGEKLEEGGRTRLLERALGLVMGVSGQRVYSPVQYTLASNLGSRAFGAGILTFMVVVVSFFLLRDSLITGGALNFAADEFDPARAGAWEVDRTLYEEDFREGRRRLLTPSIPAPVVDPETPWLRIFVPILPEADPEAMARVCPRVEPLAAAGVRLLRRANRAPRVEDRAAIEAALRCRASLWNVRIDGELVEVDPRLFTRDDGVRGLAWMVDARGIPAGAHVVEVSRDREAVDPEEAVDDADLPRRYEIPFWN